MSRILLYEEINDYWVRDEENLPYFEKGYFQLLGGETVVGSGRFNTDSGTVVLAES